MADVPGEVSWQNLATACPLSSRERSAENCVRFGRRRTDMQYERSESDDSRRDQWATSRLRLKSSWIRWSPRMYVFVRSAACFPPTSNNLEGCKSPAPLVHTCLVVQHKNNALCKAPSPSLTCGKGAIVHVLMRRQQLGS